MGSKEFDRTEWLTLLFSASGWSSLQSGGWASSLLGSLLSNKQDVWTGCCLTLSWPEVPALLNTSKNLLPLCHERKLGGWASQSCSDPGDETVVLGAETLGRAGTGWGAGGSSCRGETLGWEWGALVPGVALPCVTQDRSPAGESTPLWQEGPWNIPPDSSKLWCSEIHSSTKTGLSWGDFMASALSVHPMLSYSCVLTETDRWWACLEHLQKKTLGHSVVTFQPIRKEKVLLFKPPLGI